MGRKWNMLWLVIVFALLFSGCALQTLNDLYQVPKRSEEYNNLQSAIDQNLGSRQYCAPLSGDNLQAIQMVDLDGDGSNEYLLFAKGASEKPLQVLIFCCYGKMYTWHISQFFLLTKLTKSAYLLRI